MEALARRIRILERQAEARSGKSIVGYYAARASIRGRRHRQGFAELKFPEVFSFIEDPDGALDTLSNLVRLVISPGVEAIFWDQSDSRVTDHGAASVAAALALEARNAPGFTGFKGVYPRDERQRQVISATGMPQLLGVAEAPKGVKSYPLRRGRVDTAKGRSGGEYEAVGEEIVRHISDCVSAFGCTLRRESERQLLGILGEVLGNAVEHPGRPDWWASGYLQPDDDGAAGVCHLTIFTLGRTIAESLQMLDPGSYLYGRIQGLLGVHRKRHAFGIGWHEDDFWTLFALQEGVSRKNEGEKGLGRLKGSGTVELIGYFQKLTATSGGSDDGIKPKMAVVSGSTAVLFDGRYSLRLEDVGGGEMRSIIAFNDLNNLKERPDPRSVRHLKKFFPGTLISLKFYLNAQHLAESEETE